MAIRLIHYEGSTSGRMGWLTPVILLLAALGGAVVLLVTAFFSVIALAVGGIARLMMAAGGEEPALGKQPGKPSLAGHLFRKFFLKRDDKASSRTERAERSGNAERRTIAMGRGEDGIWRS